MIKEFEKISNRSFTVNYIPLAALKQQAVEAIDPLQKSFASIMIFYANDDVYRYEAGPGKNSSKVAFNKRLCKCCIK